MVGSILSSVTLPRFCCTVPSTTVSLSASFIQAPQPILLPRVQSCVPAVNSICCLVPAAGRTRRRSGGGHGRRNRRWRRTAAHGRPHARPMAARGAATRHFSKSRRPPHSRLEPYTARTHPRAPPARGWLRLGGSAEFNGRASFCCGSSVHHSFSCSWRFRSPTCSRHGALVFHPTGCGVGMTPARHSQ